MLKPYPPPSHFGVARCSGCGERTDCTGGFTVGGYDPARYWLCTPCFADPKRRGSK